MLPERKEKAEGDVAARYLGAIKAFLYKKTGSLQEAEDMSQEVFLRFYKNYDKHPLLSYPKALLYRIAGNLVRDEVRRRKAHKAEQHVPCDTEALVAPASRPDHILQAKAELKRVEQVILSLPEKCREVFVLSRFSGMTNRQIAAHLGISLGVVEKQISKALLRCRQEMESLDHD